jgi:hypothetical protein
MSLGLKTGPRAEKCYFTPANSVLKFNFTPARAKKIFFRWFFPGEIQISTLIFEMKKGKLLLISLIVNSSTRQCLRAYLHIDKIQKIKKFFLTKTKKIIKTKSLSVQQMKLTPPK